MQRLCRPDIPYQTHSNISLNTMRCCDCCVLSQFCWLFSWTESWDTGKGQRVSGLVTSGLLFADDVVLLAISHLDLSIHLDSLQLEMLTWGESQHLRVRGYSTLPEYKYLGIFFKSEDKMKCEINRCIVPDCQAQEGSELDLTVDLWTYPHLWSWALGMDQKSEIDSSS